jgi:Tannase and feruloyl esterase
MAQGAARQTADPRAGRTVPAAAVLADLAPVSPTVTCESLATAPLGDGVHVRSAAAVPDGQRAPYCRVLGVIDPAIQFEVRLPLARWTQRFLQTGCGGLCGDLSINVSRNQGCVPVTHGDIVLASTEMGHSGGGTADPSWAVTEPQSRVDFAYRGVRATTVAAKALIRAFYGQPARYSYFSGCSDGGGEALMEAQRYPEDFDGIAAGAPAMNFITQNTFYHGWNARVNTDAGGQTILTADKLPVLHRAALKACDASGLVDGLIGNPAACVFDPAVTLCRAGQEPSACLTATQVDVAREISRGAHDAEGRTFVISGPSPGSELGWQGVYVPAAVGGANFSASIALGTIKYLAYPEPRPAGYTLGDFQFDRATFDAIVPMHALYDATDPDLSAFKARGGRLILYHGWADPHISPFNSIAYYTAMQRVMGDAAVPGFARLFLFPGAGHCNGGEGPFDFPLLAALMSWTERGVAPDVLIATHTVGGGRGARGAGGRGAAGPPSPPAIDRARPVYPYPQVAAYRGTGDVNDAASFEARPGAAVEAKALDWMGASFYTPGYERWCAWKDAAMSCSSDR